MDGVLGYLLDDSPTTIKIVTTCVTVFDFSTATDPQVRIISNSIRRLPDHTQRRIQLLADAVACRLTPRLTEYYIYGLDLTSNLDTDLSAKPGCARKGAMESAAILYSYEDVSRR